MYKSSCMPNIARLLATKAVIVRLPLGGLEIPLPGPTDQVR
jgi:hypothetical protein